MRGKGGELLVCTESPLSPHGQTHTMNSTQDGKWRKRETEIKREDGGGWMDTGPSAESGDDGVPVCPLRRQQRSWQGGGWQAPPGGSGTEYRSDTPPHHQALLPES